MHAPHRSHDVIMIVMMVVGGGRAVGGGGGGGGSATPQIRPYSSSNVANIIFMVVMVWSLLQSSQWKSPFILMVDRGDCTFVTKVRHAQHAGAAGVIVADDICVCGGKA